MNKNNSLLASLICCVFILLLSQLVISQTNNSDNPFNVVPELIGYEKNTIAEFHNHAKHVLVSDNARETVYMITNGAYYIYHFDENNILTDAVIKLTKDQNYITAQLILRDSDWEFVDSHDDGRLYLNRHFPKLAGILLKEQEPDKPEATCFFIMPYDRD